jgi:orotate phosphoribosyltransferase
MNFATEVAKNLLQIKAIKLSPQNPFTWASGLKSPIYCDNRTLLSYPVIRDMVVEGLVEKSKLFQPFDLVAGVATAGIPHGALLADRLKLPFVYVRAKAKEHGRQNLIEGELKPGQKVLVIEDLISTGGSSLQAVEALRSEGATVVGVLAIFSYEFDAAKTSFEQAECPLETLSNYSAMTQVAVESAYVSSVDQETLRLWRQDPKQWSAQWEN